ncbi:MAG: protein translocase subunit SecD, partial [Acetanaerobacterium sp.]
MKKSTKATFFVVFALILFLAATSFFGISSKFGDVTKVYVKSANDIRWGIDIRGGVDVTFTPPEGFDATDTQMMAAEAVIKQRLVTQNITDYEVYTDTAKDRIIVRYPWKDDAASKKPEEAIRELGETALLTFREEANTDAAGMPTGVTLENIVIEGKDVKSATTVINSENSSPEIALELTNEGAVKFGEATSRLVGKKISIWMDDVMISEPVVQTAITDGSARIS